MSPNQNIGLQIGTDGIDIDVVVVVEVDTPLETGGSSRDYDIGR